MSFKSLKRDEIFIKEVLRYEFQQISVSEGAPGVIPAKQNGCANSRDGEGLRAGKPGNVAQEPGL